MRTFSVADPGGGPMGPCPPGPVGVGHGKGGHRRQPYRFHGSRPRPLFIIFQPLRIRSSQYS